MIAKSVRIMKTNIQPFRCNYHEMSDPTSFINRQTSNNCINVVGGPIEEVLQLIRRAISRNRTDLESDCEISGNARISSDVNDMPSYIGNLKASGRASYHRLYAIQ